MFNNLCVTALIPIKDHSERIEGKNFKDFCGKPLYHHIIQTLHNTSYIDKIIIDTDSIRVSEEAPELSSKINTIMRPEHLCGDYVSTNDIFAYDITQFESDLYIQTHATNPLLKTNTIADAIETFCNKNDDSDSLFSVTPYNSRFYDASGRAINHDKQVLIRTQDLPPIYEENSCLYVFTKESFLKNKSRIGENPIMYPISSIEACDIDNEWQFKLSEILYMYGQNI